MNTIDEIFLKSTSESARRSWLVIGVFALGTLGIHLLVGTSYGLHRDAYQYLVESRHVTWGYLSIPALTPFFVHCWQVLLGSPVIAIRMIPAVIGALCVIIIGKIVKGLEGNLWAIALACLAYLVPFLFNETIHCSSRFLLIFSFGCWQPGQRYGC